MAEFSPVMAACEQTEFGRLSSVNDGALVEEFKIGCKNSSTLDRVIETQLQTIAADSQGAGMLRVMAAMINPYVKCANSLETLINLIPTTRLTNSKDKIAKAKKVSYLYHLLGVQNKDFLDVIKPTNSSTLFQTLVGNPVIFSDTVPNINNFWNVDVANSARNILPLLRKKMFSMEIGSKSEYSYDSITHSYVIRLNPSNVSAYCVIGTPLISCVGGGALPVIHSYAAEKRDFEPDICLLHEMNHHFIIVLTSDFRENFDDVIPFLIAKKIDISYIVKMSEIYTGFREFQNITGITVIGGQIRFNKYSEGAYVLGKKGLSIRCSHTGKRFFNVPIGLVELIKDGVALMGVSIAPDSPARSEEFVGWNGF